MSQYYGVAWSACQTCGGEVPVTRIRYHKRWGWQCTGAPGANCWDGYFDPDEVITKLPRNEGVRHTAAPPTHTATEGVTPVVYELRDRTTSQVKQIEFGEFITVSAGSGWAAGAWRLNDPHRFIINNGFVQVRQQSFSDEVALPPGLVLYVDELGELQYVRQP